MGASRRVCTIRVPFIEQLNFPTLRADSIRPYDSTYIQKEKRIWFILLELGQVPLT